MESDGATLITHWGLSGPCVLKLSAWGAIDLNAINYHCFIKVNWLPNYSDEEISRELHQLKQNAAKKKISNQVIFDLPKRFWQFMLDEARVNLDKNWADVSKKDEKELSEQLTRFKLEVNGKSTFKEEFVTAGGVDLKEIDFKTYSSKKLPHLKIIGEALNIDAITGGFNFQSAWTSGFLAAR
jgi:predicted Rossmann fold flavoprotein